MPHQGKKNADERLLQALTCGATVEQAAQQSGVSARTVHRRLKVPSFQQRLQTARRDIVERAAAMLTAAALESVSTLLVLQRPEYPPGVRLGAAKATLELGLKVRENSNVLQRIEDLEALTKSKR
jgi:hypothetical protein